MSLYCLGLNHTTAPLELRERLAFSEQAACRTLSLLACAGSPPGLDELVILSTCNRTELYAVCPPPGRPALADFHARASGLPLVDFDDRLYFFSGAQAVAHLFQVAAGLDSQVLGEPHILGQVARALALARRCSSAGPLLARLFQSAVHAGKRARAETSLKGGADSIPSLAVDLCARSLRDLPAARVVVLGAGQMAAALVAALCKRGARQVQIVNRTLARAQALAACWDVRAAPLQDLPCALAGADVLLAAAGAPRPQVDSAVLAPARACSPDRPLLVIDIALPRAVDPLVAALPGIRLVDLDHLNLRLERSLADRRYQVSQVQAILDQEQAVFFEFLAALDVLPVIAGLHQQAERLRRAELEKTLRRLPELSPDQRARIDALTRALVSKLLDPPTRRLRAGAAQDPACLALARSLFDLPAGPAAPSELE